MTNALTPGAYLRLRREANGLSLLGAAAALACEPSIPEHDRAEWLGRIEDGVAPASFTTVAALRTVVPFDLDLLARLAQLELGLLDAASRCGRCGSPYHEAVETALGSTCRDVPGVSPPTRPNARSSAAA